MIAGEDNGKDENGPDFDVFDENGPIIISVVGSWLVEGVEVKGPGCGIFEVKGPFSVG